MADRWAGKVVWITGGGSGIGKATALEFAAQGAAVAVSGRRAERLVEVVAEIEAAGGRAIDVVCDVTDTASLEGAVTQVVDELGQLDVVVANAGYAVGGKIAELSAEDWRRQFDVNVVGAAMTARVALPHLLKSDGRMAWIGSVMAFLAAPKNGPYCASKAAVRAVAHSFGLECAGTGVTSTIIHPGFVESEIAKVDNSGVFHADRDDRRPQKLMWPADRAAKVIVRAVWQRRREHVFTAHGKFGAWTAQHMPGLTNFIQMRSAR